MLPLVVTLVEMDSHVVDLVVAVAVITDSVNENSIAIQDQIDLA
ncbi:hypothetical protein BLA29_012474 [Euroglyphus maynei]|uniref:Uncharacterized protein n=1 Tax=Euroglyphus maynei TaxID=6958 RepID=A0A1Y3ATA6_EURMA|nr:hypothetical protein BLA29_012474 [Euroglyphus maynei]